MRYYQYNEHPVSENFLRNPHIITDPYYKQCIEKVAREYLKDTKGSGMRPDLALLRLKAMKEYFKGNDLGFDVYHKMKELNPNLIVVLTETSDGPWLYKVEER